MCKRASRIIDRLVTIPVWSCFLSTDIATISLLSAFTILSGKWISDVVANATFVFTGIFGQTRGASNADITPRKNNKE